MAQRSSNVVFYAEEGEKFYVILNGLKQNEEPRSNVKAEKLAPKIYKAKIIFEDKNIKSIKKTLFLKSGIETTYKIKQKRNGKYVARGQSEADIPYEPVRQQPANQTTVITHTEEEPEEGVSLNMNGVGVSVGDGGGFSFGFGKKKKKKKETIIATTQVANNGGKVACTSPMSSIDFKDAKMNIKDRATSESRLELALQIAKTNCLLSEQVKQIMMLFEFENHKLEFAKLAYDRTYDQGNYYKVNEVFEFRSSVGKLKAYIGQ